MQIDREKVNVVLARKMMSISELSAVYGTSCSGVYKILSQKNVTPMSAGRLAKALGVDVTDLLKDKGVTV